MFATLVEVRTTFSLYEQMDRYVAAQMHWALNTSARCQISTQARDHTVFSFGEKEQACGHIVGRLHEDGSVPALRLDLCDALSKEPPVHDAVARDWVGIAFGGSVPKGGFTDEVNAVGSATEGEYGGRDRKWKIVWPSALPINPSGAGA